MAITLHSQPSARPTPHYAQSRRPIVLWLPLLLGLGLLLSLLLTTETQGGSPFLDLIGQHCSTPLHVTSALQEQTPMLFDMVAPGCQSLSFD